MSNGIYNTNFEQTAKLNIKSEFWETTVGKMIVSCNKPLNTIRDGFTSFRESCIYKVSHDSRKASIEKVLNDSFDRLQRRIRIANVQPRQTVHLYEPGDDRPAYVYEPIDEKPLFLYEQIGDLLNTVNFVVLLPNAIKPSTPAELFKLETKINAQVDYYKLYSKNHTLLWID